MKTAIYEIGFSRRFEYHNKTWTLELPVESKWWDNHTSEQYIIEKLDYVIEALQKEFREITAQIEIEEEE